MIEPCFSNISRIVWLTGGTRCVLERRTVAGREKRRLYAWFRRFYLRDLESIVVGHTRTCYGAGPWVCVWGARIAFWQWVDFHRWREFRWRGSRGVAGSCRGPDGGVVAAFEKGARWTANWWRGFGRARKVSLQN